MTGDHQFVVCITDDDGEVCNIIPHRYRLDQAGFLTAHPFDDLSPQEREAFYALNERHYACNPLVSGGVDFTIAERKAFAVYRDRVARSYWPSQDAARALLRDLPSSSTKGPDWPALWFFDQLGINTRNQ